MRPIRPLPIAATLIRLLGAVFPNTLEGTMDGKLMAMEVPMAVLMELPRNWRRLVVDCLPASVEGLLNEFFFFIAVFL